MKIIHICSSAMSFRFFLREHLINLAREGRCVIAVCGEDDKEEASFFEAHDIRFIYIPIERKISLFSDLKSLLRLIFLFLKYRPDVVHTHTPKASLLGTLAGRITAVRKVFFHCHGLSFIRYNEITSNVGYFIERLPILFAHKTLAVSPSLASYLVKNNHSFGKHISVLGAGSICGVDMSLFSLPPRLPRESRLNEEPFVIGYLGRVNEDKGMSIFIAVIDRLRMLGLNVRGKVAGMIDGADSINFPYSIDYVGSVTREEAPDFLGSCNVFLFPSCREGFGMAAAEASAMELPVIAFDIVGIKDVVIDGETGFLVYPGDVDGMVERANLLFSSPELCLSLGRNGRKYILDNFSQEKVLGDFSDFYLKNI